MPARPIRLLLVDDSQSTLDGLRMYLQEVGAPVEVVGEATDGAQAIERARALRPDLVVMDARMRGMSGFTATRLIREELPGVAVVILTMYDGEMARADAELAGAAGFVTKDDLPALEDMIATVRSRFLL